MNTIETCEGLVRDVAAAISDFPAAVRTRVIDGSYATIIQVTTGDSDYGRLLGKEGRHIKALEYLVRLAGGPTMAVSAVPYAEAEDELMIQQEATKPTVQQVVEGIARAIGGQLFWHVMTPSRTKAVVVVEPRPGWNRAEAEMIISGLVFAVSCASGVRCRFKIQSPIQPEVADGRYAAAK